MVRKQTDSPPTLNPSVEEGAESACKAPQVGRLSWRPYSLGWVTISTISDEKREALEVWEAELAPDRGARNLGASNQN